MVLANSGAIDPEVLEDYVARGGYSALAHTLREMKPDEIFLYDNVVLVREADAGRPETRMTTEFLHILLTVEAKWRRS